MDVLSFLNKLCKASISFTVTAYAYQLRRTSIYSFIKCIFFLKKLPLILVITRHVCRLVKLLLLSYQFYLFNLGVVSSFSFTYMEFQMQEPEGPHIREDALFASRKSVSRMPTFF